MWQVLQCPRLECSRHMIAKAGSKRKKCPYCNRSFKAEDNFIQMAKDQETAREMVKIFNARLV